MTVKVKPTLFCVLLCLLQFMGAGRAVGAFREVNVSQDIAYEVRGGLPEASNARLRRYPHHLDPNLINFWIRIGECPMSADGAIRQNFCPSPTNTGKWICIDDYQLCDGIKNCPNAEDEAGDYCLFYRVLKSSVELLTRSVAVLTTNTDDASLSSLPPNIPMRAMGLGNSNFANVATSSSSSRDNNFEIGKFPKPDYGIPY